MREICRGMIILLMMVCLTSTAVLAAPSLEEQKKQVEKEIKSLQDEMANIMKEINETERQLIETGELISDATKRLEKAEKQEAEQYDDMLKRIVVFYESDMGDWLEVFVNSGSIVEVLQDIENVKAIHEYDRKALEEYIAIKDEIIMLKNFLEEEQKDLQILQV